MKLLSVNGQKTADILASLQPKLRKWDWKNGMFYGKTLSGFERDAFFDRMDIKSGDKLDLLFLDANGNSVALPYIVGEKLSPVGRKKFSRTPLPGRKIAFFEESGILYIRVPEMQDPDFYVREIKSLAGRNFRAIVIDIRFNPGGNSMTWIKIVRALIAEPMMIPVKVASRTSPVARDNYRRPFQKEKIDFLSGGEYAVTQVNAELKPDEDSLRLNVPIYILVEDISSASGQFAQFAERADQLITLGKRNPVPLGSPSFPVFFYLPNSRLIVRFKFYIDLYNCRSAEEVFHTRPEVELNHSLNEVIDYYNMDLSLPLEERLKRHDPYFKKMLEHLSGN